MFSLSADSETNKMEFEKYIKGFKQEGIEYLRKNVPEVKKIESLDCLEELKFTKADDLSGVMVMLHYEARAPSLFPYVRQRLIEKGINKNSMLGTSVKNRGASAEKYKVRMGFYGNTLQINLSLRK